MASFCRTPILLLALATTALWWPTAADACPPEDYSITRVEAHPQLGPRAIQVTVYVENRADVGADLYIDDYPIGEIRLRQLAGEADTHRGTFVINEAIWERMPRPLTIRVVPVIYWEGARSQTLVPEWITIHEGPPPARGSGADQLLFAFFAISLFGVMLLYRREDNTEQRIRLTAAAGLIAVLFLCTAPAMPWSEGVALDGSAELCMLGDEARCVAEQAAFAGISATALETTLERTNWATAGIRAGHMTLLILLLPAFIWLMVAPRNRGAQALVVGGAIPAVVTALSTVAYGAILGSWTVRAGGAPDLTLVATSTLVIVSAIAGITGHRLRQSAKLPKARVKRV